MTRAELVMAALSTSKGKLFSPVQVQKLFFLIDRELGERIGGPYFDFQPYNYGPFDKDVYEELTALFSAGMVEEVPERNWISYRLSIFGQERGERVLASLDPAAKDFFQKASSFVRGLSFTDLVRAIYKAYPDMRANSVFQG